MIDDPVFAFGDTALATGFEVSAVGTVECTGYALISYSESDCK